MAGKNRQNRQNRQQATAQEPDTKVAEIELTNHDLSNIIAFGNRAQMTGQEADVWVQLKMRLVAELQRLDGDEPQIVVPTEGLPPELQN